MVARTPPAAPTSGQKLRASTISWLLNPPMFRMYQTIAQSVPNTTDTHITFDTSQYDTESGRRSVTPWDYQIPVGQSGRWQFSWAVPLVLSATGARESFLLQNGTRITGAPTAGAAASTDYVQAFGITTIPVSAGDVMSVWCWQNSGGALNTQVGANNAGLFEGRLVSLANP